MKKDAILLIENFDLLEKKIIIFIDQDKNYNKFYINKKNGGKREILSPSKDLFVIQKTLLNYIVNVYTPTKNSFAYIKHRSIVQNASFHTNKNFVFNIDLKDFFKSITKDMFKKSFLLNYDFNIENEHLLNYVLKYCFYDDYLPQGAPTSPVLSNICCIELDKNLSKLAEKFELDYTRYADDITFSGNENVFYKKNEFRKKLYEIIINNGFNINEKKISLNRKDKRQVVTGLVVNKKVNVPKKYIKNIRLYLYWWEKFGYNEAQNKFHSHKDFCSSKTMNFSLHLNGLLNFISSVLGKKSNVYLKLKSRFEKLNNYIYEIENINKCINIEISKAPLISIDSNNIDLVSKDNKDITTTIEELRGEAFTQFIKQGDVKSAEKLYRISFKSERNLNELRRDLVILGIKKQFFSNSKDIIKIINDLLVDSKKSLSKQEVRELNILKEFFSNPIENTYIQFDGQTIIHEEMISIMGSNKKLLEALKAKDKTLFMSVIGQFLETGIKINTKEALSIASYFSTSDRLLSNQIVPNNLNKVSSKYIPFGEGVSEEDLKFSEYIDSLEEGSSVELEYTEKKNPDNENVNTTKERFGILADKLEVKNLSGEDLLREFNSVFQGPVERSENKEQLRSENIEQLRALLINYRDSNSKEALKEFLDRLIDLDTTVPTFRLTTPDGSIKYIPKMATTFGFKDSDYYKKIFSNIKNNKVEEFDPAKEDMIIGSLKGLLFRLALEDLYTTEGTKSESIRAKIENITAFKLLYNEYVSGNIRRITSSNSELFNEDEIITALKNQSIPTYDYEYSETVTVKIPELFFTPNVGTSATKGVRGNYVYNLLKGLNPDVSDSIIGTIAQTFFLNKEYKKIKSQTRVNISRNDKRSFVNRNVAVISSQKGFDGDPLPSHVEMIERLRTKIKELKIGDVKTVAPKIVYGEGDEDLKVEENTQMTWNEVLENLDKELAFLKTNEHRDIEFTEHNDGSEVNNDLKHIPLLHLFLGVGEGPKNSNYSKQFAMATYFEEPTPGVAKPPYTVSINPLYKSFSKSKYAVLAQQLVLLSDSARTDIYVDENQRNVPIGKRFSTTGNIIFSTDLIDISNETSRQEQVEREINAEISSLNRENKEKEEGLETLESYSKDNIFIVNEDNKLELNLDIKVSILELLKKDSLSEDRIKFYKSVIEHGEDFLAKDGGFFYLLDRALKSNVKNPNDFDITEEDFNKLLSLQDFIINEGLTKSFDDYKKFEEELSKRNSTRSFIF